MKRSTCTHGNNLDRYLSIMHWLRKRYTRGARLCVSIAGSPTAYSRLELAFARRYLKLPTDQEERHARA